MSEVFIRICNASITASYIVLAVLLLRLVLRRAPRWIQCLLWGIVALRLVLPVSIESALSLIPNAEPIPKDIELATEPAIDSGIRIVDDAVNPILSGSFSPPTPAYSANPLQIVIGVAAYVWVAGIVLMLLYGILSYLRLAVRVRPSLRGEGNLYFCDRIDTPFILGILRPRIYIPSGMDAACIEYVARHERAHLTRRDHLWKPLGFLLLAVYWFNPLLWVAYILLCRDIETACDEKVIRDMSVEDKRGYSEALVSCSIHRRTVMACPLAFGEVGVKSRIRAVLRYRKPAFWIILVAALAGVVTAVCFLTSPPSRLDDITNERGGYYITDQYRHDITLSIPRAVLSDAAFTTDGQTFAENEVIAYRDATTTIYLDHVCISNEGDEYLYFCLDFSYDLPKKSGTLLYPYTVTDDHAVTTCFAVTNRTLDTELASYEDAVLVRGQGPGTQIWLYVSTQAFREATGTLLLHISLSRLSYQRGKDMTAPLLTAADSPYSDEYIRALYTMYPEFFGLDTTDGLSVCYCQYAQNSYSLYLISGQDSVPSVEEQLHLPTVSSDIMCAILSTYEVDPAMISVKYVGSPLSSYAVTQEEIAEGIMAVRANLGLDGTAVDTTKRTPSNLVIVADNTAQSVLTEHYTWTFRTEDGTEVTVTHDSSEALGTLIPTLTEPIQSDYAFLHFEILPDETHVEIYDTDSGQLVMTAALTNDILPLVEGQYRYVITAVWSTHEIYSGSAQYTVWLTK